MFLQWGYMYAFLRVEGRKRWWKVVDWIQGGNRWGRWAGIVDMRHLSTESERINRSLAIRFSLSLV